MLIACCLCVLFPSFFHMGAAIYRAAGCQHKIAIYTAAVPEPIQIYTRLPCVHIKSLFTRHPFKTQIGYIHCSRVYPKNCYLHGSRSRVKSAIYIAAGCIQKSLFTRQPFKIQFKISGLLGVHILYLFT